MRAHFNLIRISEHEDILETQGMRQADDRFVPALKEVGSRFGVSIEYLPESGFNLQYEVKPPLPIEQVQAFAELVTSVAIEYLDGPYPSVGFSNQEDPTLHAKLIVTNLDFVS